MLTKIRIEVEEETAEACVEALWKYEHAMQLAEARRYLDCWPLSVSSEGDDPSPEEQWGIREHAWKDDVAARSFFNGELGREVVEEVIEYDEGIPGYRGRRVLRFTRIDMRSRAFVAIESADSEEDYLEIRDMTGRVVGVAGTGIR